MSPKTYVSARGVYYNLEHSPYRYIAPTGECFVFSSNKKMEIYTRVVTEMKQKIEKVVQKFSTQLGADWSLITRQTMMLKIYRFVYNDMEVV